MAYTFCRWFRTGLSAALVAPQTPATEARRAKLSVGVEAAGTAIPSQVGNVTLDVLGPGDVAGLDRRQVIRTFPVPNTSDSEPTYFAHLELDRPDLPWLFTPFGPTTAGLLRPWLCLAVVEQGDEVKLEPTLPLPTLTVTGSEVAKLPKLDEAHAWAHVQVTGDAADGVEQIAKQEPERVLARLICPRELDPDTAYLACLVPAFEIGALAGLGRTLPATLALDAWSATDAEVELPVYYSWEFSTGGVGDFKSLVLRLEGRSTLAGVGTRPLDLTSPGFGLADRVQPTTVRLGGALRVDEPAPAPVDEQIAVDLEPMLNVADAVAPPIYGRWHAAVTKVSGTSPSRWPDELNVDPRHRVAAGLGTLVVQERQEDLMAAIWEQLGEILRANQLLRQAQLAVAASERVVARHLAPLADSALLSIAGPALARIRVAPGRTARKSVADSCLPLLALSGAFRRIVRARGPLERRLARLGRTSFPDLLPPPAIDEPSLILALANGSLAPKPVQLPSGAVPLPTTLGFRWRDRQPPRRPPFRDPESEPGPLEELAETFAELARRATAPACKPLDVGALAGTLRVALDPDTAVAGRARSQIRLPNSNRVVLSARLDPIMAAPEVPTPMIGPLQELGTDWLLPGISEVPQNTLAIVEPNSAFIESYMVGLNHELGRELLWRGFPTDQRGTVFAHFWDRRGSVATKTAPVPEHDIPPIHEWRDSRLDATPLGANIDHGAQQLVVLLIRGDLLQRYPRATIYVQRGRWKRDAGGDIVFADELALREPVPLADATAWEQDARFPSFAGRAGGDITFLGFPVAKEEVRGLDRSKARTTTKDDVAGWYVVFQEQPTEPRFGMGTATLPPPGARRSDDLAALLLRPAFRLFVHGSDLVPG